MAKNKPAKKPKKKFDLNELYKKYQPTITKTADQMRHAAKTAEEDIAKMYKIAQSHVELQMKNLQKEKFYHELGKYVAEKLDQDQLDVSDLKDYKKRLAKLSQEGQKIKKKIDRIGKKTKKTKKTSKKKKK